MAGVSSVGGIVIPVMVVRSGDKTALLRMKQELMAVSAAVREVNTSMVAQASAAGKATKGVRGFLKGMTNVRWALVNVALVAMTVRAAFNLLIKPSIELESSMANVRKTTNLARDDIAELRREFVQLSKVLPVSAKELADIGVIAGQLGLGVGDNGAENIRSFVSVVAMMATATGMTAEDVAKDLAKISQSFKLPIADAVNLASVINELENTSAATSQEITESMKRVGASASQLGIGVDFIAALEATLVSAGMKSSRAGTRMRSAINSMAQDVGKFATLTGTTFNEFQRLLEEDAQGALMLVLESLNEMGVNSQRTAAAVEHFGKIGGFAIATLAGNYDELSGHVETANEQMMSGNSIIRETALQMETTAMQAKLLGNSIRSAFLNNEGFINRGIKSLRLIGELKDEFGMSVYKQLNTWRPGKFKKQEKELYNVRSAELITAMNKAGYTIERQEAAFEQILSSPTLVDALDTIKLYLEVAQNAVAASEDLGGATIDLGVKYNTAQEAIEAYSSALFDVKNYTGGVYEELSDLEFILSIVEDTMENSFTEEEIDRIKRMATATAGLSVANTNLAIASKQASVAMSIASKALSEELSNIQSIYDSYTKALFVGESEQLNNIHSIELAIKKETLAQLGLNSAVEETNNTLESQSNSYEAWVETINQFVTSALTSGNKLGKNVSGTVETYKSLLLSTSKFSDTDTNLGNSELTTLQELELERQRAQLEYDVGIGENKYQLGLYIDEVERGNAIEIDSLATAKSAIKDNWEELSRLKEQQKSMNDGWDVARLAISIFESGLNDSTVAILLDLDAQSARVNSLIQDYVRLATIQGNDVPASVTSSATGISVAGKGMPLTDATSNPIADLMNGRWGGVTIGNIAISGASGDPEDFAQRLTRELQRQLKTI